MGNLIYEVLILEKRVDNRVLEKSEVIEPLIIVIVGRDCSTTLILTKFAQKTGNG